VSAEVVDLEKLRRSCAQCSLHVLCLPAGIGGVDGCTYDFMRDVELYPESDRLGLLTRGVLALGGGLQAFAEFSGGRAKTIYTGTSNRIDADAMQFRPEEVEVVITVE